MDGSVGQSTLPSDIERALQHAVGQANNVSALSDAQSGMKKRKKKRSRDVQEDGQDAEVESASRKKKKKSKKGKEVEEQGPAVVPVHEGAPAVDGSSGDLPKKKKKKKKGDKGKQPASLEPLHSEPQPSLPPEDSQAQSLAFLNAVVSAASATAGGPPQSTPPYGFQQPSFPPYPSPPQHYNEYGPSQSYPYPPLPPHMPEQLTFAMPPELAGGSSDDILRALQDLDLEKLASVLKTLGDAATAANIPMMSLPSVLSPHSERTARAAAMTARHVPDRAAPRSQNRRITNINLPPDDLSANQEHAHILATKWLSASKLKELEQSEGLVYKKGKFSAIEEQQLSNAIALYKSNHGMDDEDFSQLVIAKGGSGKDADFWSELTSAVSMRPIIAIYHHVRRHYHPLSRQGAWMQSEDEKLKSAVLEFGQQWEKVSVQVGRMASDCRDRYRNHIQYSDGRNTGPWTREEEDMLTRIVTEMTIQQGKDMDNDIFWSAVSHRMGNLRGRQQCRIKWTDSLSKTVKNRGHKPRWSAEDGYILVHKVDSLRVNDDSEIDWKTLADPHWNFWSAHTLQRRWLTMKRSVRGHEDMSHAEIMDILRVKKAHLPPRQKVVSAEAVEDSDDGEAGPNVAEAGPSTTVYHARRDGSSSSDSENEEEFVMSQI